MKITRVHATPLAVPFKETHVTWTGTYSAKSTLLIEISTDEGITGIGEAPGIPLPEINQLIVKEFEPLLVGADPFAINLFHQRALDLQSKIGLTATTWKTYRNIANNALGGIDIALWDIVGKAMGQPVHRLLGGALRDRIDMFAWIHRKDQREMVEDALQFKQQGFRVYYLKIGLGTQRDRADLMALRDALGPTALIRGDANGAWSATQALQEIRAFEDLKLDWIEQPVTEADFDGFERVARVSPVPLCIDQGVNTNQLAYEAIRRRLADAICSDIHRVGGITALREMAAMAQLANIQVCRHAGPEFAISGFAHLHAMSTIPNASLGNQTYATTIADDIVNEPTTAFRDGSLTVPQTPGIGVTLDRDKVAKYAEMYVKMRSGA